MGKLVIAVKQPRIRWPRFASENLTFEHSAIKFDARILGFIPALYTQTRAEKNSACLKQSQIYANLSKSNLRITVALVQQRCMVSVRSADEYRWLYSASVTAGWVTGVCIRRRFNITGISLAGHMHREHIQPSVMTSDLCKEIKLLIHLVILLTSRPPYRCVFTRRHALKQPTSTSRSPLIMQVHATVGLLSVSLILHRFVESRCAAFYTLVTIFL
jgi:hypothetical protein